MTAEIQRHWDLVASFGCMVTGSKHGVTLHHAHGGSLKDRGIHRSAGRKTSDWLVIPLHERLHVGPGGIDGFPRPPVRVWEAKHGSQAAMLDRICELTGVDVWEKAAAELKPVPRRKA